MTARQAKKYDLERKALVQRWRQQEAELEAKAQREREDLERKIRHRAGELEIAHAREYFELRQRFGAELGPGPTAILEGKSHAHRR